MDYKKVVEILNNKYHHNLYYSGCGVNLKFNEKNCLVNQFDSIDNILNEKPGFWFSLSKNNEVIRCGTHSNIRLKVNLFERINCEYIVYVNESVKDGDNGMKNMKRIKKEFKKLLKNY